MFAVSEVEAPEIRAAFEQTAIWLPQSNYGGLFPLITDTMLIAGRQYGHSATVRTLDQRGQRRRPGEAANHQLIDRRLC